jgi:hypothetical protein
MEALEEVVTLAKIWLRGKLEICEISQFTMQNAYKVMYLCCMWDTYMIA